MVSQMKSSPAISNNTFFRGRENGHTRHIFFAGTEKCLVFVSSFKHVCYMSFLMCVFLVGGRAVAVPENCLVHESPKEQ